MTLYAYWIPELAGASEYTVDFYTYDGDTQEYGAVETIGGCVIAEELPEPSREGYSFLGWYVSAYDKADKLTYAYEAGTPLQENTTLYALWQADGGKAVPEVSVTQDGVTWTAVDGMRTYKVRVEGPAGFETLESVQSSTGYEVNFAGAPAGEYTVTVYASPSATADEEAADTVSAVRYYKNKALARVSKFSVAAPSALVFEGVPGAQRYYLSIECGDPEHEHERVSLGTSTNYNFVNCAMQEGGIRFTVTAEADRARK